MLEGSWRAGFYYCLGVSYPECVEIQLHSDSLTGGDKSNASDSDFEAHDTATRMREERASMRKALRTMCKLPDTGAHEDYVPLMTAIVPKGSPSYEIYHHQIICHSVEFHFLIRTKIKSQSNIFSLFLKLSLTQMLVFQRNPYAQLTYKLYVQLC